jgi:DNA-binding MarR family transcriptional regulator
VTEVEPTDDSVDTIADALLVVSRLLVAISARSIAGVDQTLTIPQFRALVIMSNVGPVKLTSLARLLGLPPDTVAPMVQRLDRAGLVARADAAVPRVTVVGLSRRGQRVVDKVTLMRRAEIASVVSMMPLGQRRELVTALSAFASASGENVVDVDDLL